MTLIDQVEARKAVARCIEIVRETHEDFLSPEYAGNDPMNSFAERLACDIIANAIENEFAIGTDEQRRLLGKPSLIEEWRVREADKGEAR